MKHIVNRKFLFGLVFIISLVMIYFGINFLKGINIFGKQHRYYAVFEDVSMLLVSSPIYIKGYQIGLITDVEMITTDPVRFLVAFNLKEKLPVTKESYLEYRVDLFGASTVNLVLVPEAVPLLPGDTITGRGRKELMESAAGVLPKADSILVRVDSLLISLHRLMSDPGWEQSVKGMGNTLAQLNRSSQLIEQMVGTLEKDIPEISSNLKSTSADLKKVSEAFGKMDFQGTYASIDKTVENLKLLSEKMNRNDNSFGLLLNDRKLHDSLRVTIDRAAELLQEIREHPDKYLSVRVKLF